MRNCYGEDIRKFDLIVSEEADFDLTYHRVYVVRDIVGYNLIQIQNDKGKIDTYAAEYFRFYEGERIY